MENSEETAPAYNEKDNRNFAMFAHLGGLVFFILFANIIIPLVIWLLKRDELPLVNHAGRESLNFQLSLMIYFVIGLILTPVVIGFLILPILLVIDLVMVIKAAIAASEGKEFTYPLAIHFIK